MKRKHLVAVGAIIAIVLLPKVSQVNKYQLACL